MTFALLLGAAVLCLLSLLSWWAWQIARDNSSRCRTCDEHAFDLAVGYTTARRPRPHSCPEAR